MCARHVRAIFFFVMLRFNFSWILYLFCSRCCENISSGFLVVLHFSYFIFWKIVDALTSFSHFFLSALMTFIPLWYETFILFCFSWWECRKQKKYFCSFNQNKYEATQCVKANSIYSFFFFTFSPPEQATCNLDTHGYFQRVSQTLY